METTAQVYLPKKLRDLLVTALQNNRLSTDELYITVSMLKEAENELESEVIMAGLGEVYPVFKDFLIYEEGTAQISFEQEIKEIFPALIKANPLLATQVIKASQEAGMTKSKLIERFPEMSAHLQA